MIASISATVVFGCLIVVASLYLSVCIWSGFVILIPFYKSACSAQQACTYTLVCNVVIRVGLCLWCGPYSGNCVLPTAWCNVVVYRGASNSVPRLPPSRVGISLCAAKCVLSSWTCVFMGNRSCSLRAGVESSRLPCDMYVDCIANSYHRLYSVVRRVVHIPRPRNVRDR